MKVCKNCNNLFADDANFCPDCGSQLESVHVYNQAKPKPKLVRPKKIEPTRQSPIPEPPVPIFNNQQNHQSDSVCSTVTPESTTCQFAPTSSTTRKVAIAIGLFWCTFILFEIFVLLFNALNVDYDHPARTVLGVTTNTFRLAIVLFCAINKDFFTSIIGRIAAFVISALYITYILNWLTKGFDIFSFCDSYSYLVNEITQLLIISIFLFGTKLWLPSKIFGCITYIPPIFSAIFWTLYIMDSDINYHLMNLMNISNTLFTILTVITAIITFIGIKKVK